MSQTHDQAEMKQELSKFINLLQTDFKQNTYPTESRIQCEDYPLQKKLSIIFSAS